MEGMGERNEPVMARKPRVSTRAREGESRPRPSNVDETKTHSQARSITRVRGCGWQWINQRDGCPSRSEENATSGAVRLPSTHGADRCQLGKVNETGHGSTAREDDGVVFLTSRWIRIHLDTVVEVTLQTKLGLSEANGLSSPRSVPA